MKVLIVDDDPVNRRVIEAKVTQWGYETIPAADGLEALTLLRTPNAPQLVILDWQMPNMCGDEVCRRARAELGSRPLHIILLTANRVTREDMVAGIEAGADDYLRKPCDSDELRARLKAGERSVKLQTERIANAQAHLDPSARSDGDVIICRYCRRFRGPNRTWIAQVQLTDTFTQGRILSAICEECLEKQVEQIIVDTV